MLRQRVSKGVKRRVLHVLRAWAGEDIPQPTENRPPPVAEVPADWRKEFDDALKDLDDLETEPEPAPPLVQRASPQPRAESGVDVVEPQAQGPQALTMESLQEVLDEMVRPALQADGGDIELVKIEDNDVYVTLVGACSSCPSSIMTMKMGVERLLQDEFEEMGELIQVDETPSFF
jgi:Fe-S cluster biogenesis protein NfuA